jgi:hypothetical protein
MGSAVNGFHAEVNGPHERSRVDKVCLCVHACKMGTQEQASDGEEGVQFSCFRILNLEPGQGSESNNISRQVMSSHKPQLDSVRNMEMMSSTTQGYCGQQMTPCAQSTSALLQQPQQVLGAPGQVSMRVSSI